MPTYETEDDRQTEYLIAKYYCEYRGYDDFIRQKRYSPIDYGLIKNGEIVEFLECKGNKFPRMFMKNGLHFIGMEKLYAATVIQALGFKCGFAVKWADVVGYHEFNVPDQTGIFIRNDHRKDEPELGVFYDIEDFEIFRTIGETV